MFLWLKRSASECRKLPAEANESGAQHQAIARHLSLALPPAAAAAAAAPLVIEAIYSVNQTNAFIIFSVGFFRSNYELGKAFFAVASFRFTSEFYFVLSFSRSLLVILFFRAIHHCACVCVCFHLTCGKLEDLKWPTTQKAENCFFPFNKKAESNLPELSMTFLLECCCRRCCCCYA